MLICEQLFLLLTKAQGSALTGYRSYGVTAGAITDLLLSERITLDGAKDPKAAVVNAQPTGRASLDHMLPQLAAAKPKKVSSLVTSSKLDPSKIIGHDFAAAGIVRIEEARMLGLVPQKYVETNPAPEQQLRAHVAAVLAGHAQPTQTDGPVLAILQGLGAVKSALREEVGSLQGKALKRRVEEIAADVPAAAAVKGAIDALNAAMMATIMVTTITTTTVNS